MARSNGEKRGAGPVERYAPILIALISLALSVANLLKTNHLERDKLDLDRLRAASNLINDLTSGELLRKDIAKSLLEGLGLPRSVIAQLEARIAIADATPAGRSAAVHELHSLVRDHDPAVRYAAQRGLEQYFLATELRTRKLLALLRQATNFATTGSMENLEQALQIYSSVIGQLSVKGKSQLDQQLLKQASAKNFDIESRVQIYSKLFEPFLLSPD